MHETNDKLKEREKDRKRLNLLLMSSLQKKRKLYRRERLPETNHCKIKRKNDAYLSSFEFGLIYHANITLTDVK